MLFATRAVLGVKPGACVGGSSNARARVAVCDYTRVNSRRAVVAVNAGSRLPTAASTVSRGDHGIGSMFFQARLRGAQRGSNATRAGQGPRRGRRLTVTTNALDGDIANTGDTSLESSSEPKRSVWYGRGLLIFVAAAYGSLSVAFKYVYGMPGPPSAGVIGAVRGVFAAACFIPMILKETKKQDQAAAENPESALSKTSKGDSKKFWRAAGELAFWNLVAQGACNVALLFTDATRVSFLTQASIAFTPVLVSLTGDRVGGITWAGCALAIAGVVLLGFDGGGEIGAVAASTGLNIGDIIALIGAASYSLYIFRISNFAKQGLPGNLTQAWKTVILSVLYLGWAACDLFTYLREPLTAAAPWAGWQNPVAWGVLIFTAVVPGYFADICQAKGQESVEASESQVLLAGEPLFAAVMGAILLGESLGTYGYVGGAGLVAGAIMAGLDDVGGEKSSD